MVPIQVMVDIVQDELGRKNVRLQFAADGNAMVFCTNMEPEGALQFAAILRKCSVEARTGIVMPGFDSTKPMSD